jgi:enamine deaminase RidA (YjgF/YER057c/UK114 family)
MANLKAVLEAAGTTMDNVVKVNVFIADMKDFSAMNEVYTQYFGEQKPCRTYVISGKSSKPSRLTKSVAVLLQSSCLLAPMLRLNV